MDIKSTCFYNYFSWVIFNDNNSKFKINLYLGFIFTSDRSNGVLICRSTIPPLVSGTVNILFYAASCIIFTILKCRGNSGVKKKTSRRRLWIGTHNTRRELTGPTRRCTVNSLSGIFFFFYIVIFCVSCVCHVWPLRRRFELAAAPPSSITTSWQTVTRESYSKTDRYCQPRLYASGRSRNRPPCHVFYKWRNVHDFKD